MSEVFRPVAEAEAAQFQQFLTAAYAEDLAYGIHFAASFATVEDIRRHLAHNLCYILERDGEFVASCSLRLPWGPNPGPEVFPHLGWVSTHPHYKRQGLSARMLDWVEQEILMGQLKAPAVTLGTAKEHPWLIAMYEKRGYVAYAERRLSADHLTVYMKKILRT